MVIQMIFSQNKKKFSEIVEEFLAFIEGKKLIIHNAEFDLSHINNELLILGKDKLKNDVEDTLNLARNKYPGSSINLDALCKRYKIDNSKRTKHTALIDCELLSKVYINLIDQKEPKLNFDNDSLTEEEKTNNDMSYYKKIIKPTPEELKLHSSFLKSQIKKNYFN